MSVQIGQFRRNQRNVNDFFQQKINYTITKASFISKDGEKYYNELTISEPKGQQYFTEGKTYYIQGGQVKPTSEKCTIKLISSNGTQQIIGRFSSKLDFTFTPNRPDYQFLVFAFEKDNAGSFAYAPDLYELGNVCGDSGTKVPKKVKKIGIQGMPGLRFAINGEDFIMGKSGIFMLGDMDITQISFYVRDFSKAAVEENPEPGKPTRPVENYINYFPYITDGKEFFIMDYEY